MVFLAPITTINNPNLKANRRTRENRPWIARRQNGSVKR